MCGFYSNPTADWSLHALVIVDSVGIPSSWRRRKNFRPVRWLRSPSPSLVLARGAVQRKGDRRRASVNIVLSACGSGLLRFLPYLPQSSSSLKRKFRIGLGIRFHRFMLCCKKEAILSHILTQEGTRDTIQSRPQTCHGTRLAKVKSW